VDPGLGKGPAADAEFIFQDAAPAPFEQSTTYVVVGERTKESGCAYTYPEFRMPADVERWQVRDLGIDPERCLKLVEEGMPTDEDPLTGVDASISEDVASSDGEPSAAAAVGDAAVASVASGYSRAWTEDVAGWDVSVDTTWISFTYSGSCVTGGNASASWSWIAGTGWRLVSGSNGVTANRTCGRVPTLLEKSDGVGSSAV
jgi:hypothetical protein